ncbi:MAG: hypothetical protein RBT59_01625 [Arcobacteraceae bacterium]|jgi:hypothetical protein|nr:hypothetical protein [Arcobacteraceae bacterium]
MKKFFVAMVVFVGTFLNGDYLDISIGTKPNYNFEEYLFKDINITNTQKLEKKISYNELHLSGNFNNIIGFNYYKNDIASPDKFDSKEIYIGSDKTKFLGYQKDETTIHYGTRVSKAKTTRYTVYDVLTIEQNKLSSTDSEIIAPGTTSDNADTTPLPSAVPVYRYMDYQKVIISSENFYNHVKENTIDGENYFNGVAISQNFSSLFRVYGVVIASYEQHDYSKGSANYIDTNGTTKSIFNESVADRDKLVARDGRFKGFGYGYKITAEAYWKDFSLFLTSYYKKTNLKNYESTIKYAASDAEQVSNVIALDKINFLQQYTSFGLRYRF